MSPMTVDVGAVHDRVDGERQAVPDHSAASARLRA